MGLQPALVIEADRVDSLQRISSRRPKFVLLLATLGTAVAIRATLRAVVSSEELPWAMLALGMANAVVALATLMTWKHVRSDDRRFVVSDLFKSETFAFDDLCMVVEARGMIWNTVRLHFNRSTRFGWDISFVPARSVGNPRSLVAAWRTRRMAKEGN